MLYALTASGFAFVNVVPLLNKRKKYFWSKKDDFTDFKNLMLVWTPVLFFSSMIINLRGQKDLELYCSEGAK